jgi:hypothetical protein
MTSDEQQKELEDNATANEIERLKSLETANEGIKKALDAQIQKNQINDQIFMRISAFLDEILKTTARTTYLATMAKDIVDNRNQSQQ